jgi:hypothetical protein
MRRPRRVLLTVAGVAAAWMALDFIVLDYWKLQGSVVADSSGEGIAGSRILVSLIGDRPHSPVPHARHDTGVCITSFEVESDERGHFSLRRFSSNQYLINKRAVVTAFAPGWYSSDFTLVPVDPGLAATSSVVRVRLKRDEGRRWSSRSYSKDGSPLSMDPQANEYQRTMSRAITQTSRILSESYVCGVDGWRYVSDVLSYVASHAKTVSEKQFIMRECKALLRRRVYLEYQSSRLSVDSQMPAVATQLRCDESLFGPGVAQGARIRTEP